jgi:hypothetical protein
MKKAKKLFRISMTAYKTFYVEARDQSSALHHGAVQDEQHISQGCDDFPWEHNETDASEVPADEAKFVRERHAEEIAKERR